VTDLTAIVISRNEEVRIGDCLASCLRSIRRSQDEGLIDQAEVVLVDSASTDRTVEIAQKFPISIVQLKAGWPLSAGAGRYVGLRHARGQLILFVDGDYCLFDDWLPSAIRAIRGDSRFAAICGRDVEGSGGRSILSQYQKASLEAVRSDPEAVPIGLYRRDLLEKAGGINPFLKGAEDRDLARRLRSAGYSLIRLPIDMGRHEWSDVGELDYITYFHSVLTWSIGDGQASRASPRDKALQRDARRRYFNARFLYNYELAAGVSTVILVNLLGAFRPGGEGLFVLDGIVAVLLAAVRSARGWTLRELGFQFHVIPYALIRHAGFFLGYFRRPRNSMEYPRGEIVLQTSPVSISKVRASR